MRRAVTLVVPDGYANGEEFAKDCGFEIWKPAADPWDAYHNRSYAPVEERAEQIYDAFVAPPHIRKPPWEAGGNSTKQDEARQLARKELRAAGHDSALSTQTQIPRAGKNHEIPMPAGFSLIDNGRICRDDDPDCRHPLCDCAR